MRVCTLTRARRRAVRWWRRSDCVSLSDYVNISNVPQWVLDGNFEGVVAGYDPAVAETAMDAMSERKSSQMHTVRNRLPKIGYTWEVVSHDVAILSEEEWAELGAIFCVATAEMWMMCCARP